MNSQALARALTALGPVPAYDRIPRMDDLVARTHALAVAYPDLISVETVGRSAGGEPIEMIAVGSGPRSALLVGAPHPNEPIGCVTIEFLLQRLAGSADLRAALPYRWHFIKAIEPDALRLNEGWFDHYGDLEHYLLDFFRPAVVDQAEYGFPFAPEIGVPVTTTAENDAWRRAFEIAGPDLLCSLHNADYGGAFYILSRSVPDLIRILPQQPHLYGVGLNDVGEPLSDGRGLGRGIFDPFEPEAFVKAAQKRGEPVRSVWEGGDCSAGYAERSGTFALISEVAYWEDEEEAGRTHSVHTRRDLFRIRNQWNAEIVRLGTPILERASSEGDVAYGLIYRSARETLERAASQIGSLADDSDSARLTHHAFRKHRTGLHLIALRKVALMRRLALIVEQVAETGACEEYIRRGARDLLGEVPLRTLPINSLVATQSHACLSAAACFTD